MTKSKKYSLRYISFRDPIVHQVHSKTSLIWTPIKGAEMSVCIMCLNYRGRDYNELHYSLGPSKLSEI